MTKPMTNTQTYKGNDSDAEKTLPPTEKNKGVASKPSPTKFPLKKEQLATLAELKTLGLECDEDVLAILIRKDYKQNPERFADSICHLRREIEKGTQFKKSRIAFFRHCLNGKVCLIDPISLENKDFAVDYATANNWINVKITDKYVQCKITKKEIGTNMPQNAFVESLMQLHDLSESYRS